MRDGEINLGGVCTGVVGNEEMEIKGKWKSVILTVKIFFCKMWAFFKKETN